MPVKKCHILASTKSDPPLNYDQTGHTDTRNFIKRSVTGSSTSDTPLDTNLCGTDLSTVEYTSSDRYILVTFTSDSSGASEGFQMTYLSVPDTCKYMYRLLLIF